MQLCLVAGLDGDHLVLRFIDSTTHSTFPIVASDPWDLLAGDGQPAEGAQRPWSLAQLDAALRWQGYQRTTPWRDGPVAEVTRPACPLRASSSRRPALHSGMTARCPWV